MGMCMYCTIVKIKFLTKTGNVMAPRSRRCYKKNTESERQRVSLDHKRTILPFSHHFFPLWHNLLQGFVMSLLRKELLFYPCLITPPLPNGRAASNGFGKPTARPKARREEMKISNRERTILVPLDGVSQRYQLPERVT